MSEKKLHKHGGKSSEAILDAKRVLSSLQLSEGDVFMDAVVVMASYPEKHLK
jgi:hypothetical protein